MTDASLAPRDGRGARRGAEGLSHCDGHTATRRRGQRWARGRGPRGCASRPGAVSSPGTGNAQGPGLLCGGKRGLRGPGPPNPRSPARSAGRHPCSVPTPSPCGSGTLPRPLSSPAGRARSCSSAVPGTDAACAEKLLGWAAPAQPCGAPPAAGTRPQRHSRAGPRHASRTRTGSAQQSGRKPGTAFPGRRTAPLRPTAGLRPSSSQRLPDYQSSGCFSLQQVHAAPRLRWGPGLGVCHLR